jgi:hypothetical protein
MNTFYCFYKVIKYTEPSLYISSSVIRRFVHILRIYKTFVIWKLIFYLCNYFLNIRNKLKYTFYVVSFVDTTESALRIVMFFPKADRTFHLCPHDIRLFCSYTAANGRQDLRATVKAAPRL